MICCSDLLRTKAIIPQLLEALVVDSSQLSPSLGTAFSKFLSWGPPTSNNWSVGQWTLCLNLEQPLSSIPAPELLTESAEALCNKCTQSSTFLSAQFCFPCFPQAWIPQVLPSKLPATHISISVYAGKTWPKISHIFFECWDNIGYIKHSIWYSMNTRCLLLPSSFYFSVLSFIPSDSWSSEPRLSNLIKTPFHIQIVKYMLGKSFTLLMGASKNFKLVSDQVILLFRKIPLAIVCEKFR